MTRTNHTLVCVPDTFQERESELSFSTPELTPRSKWDLECCTILTVLAVIHQIMLASVRQAVVMYMGEPLQGQQRIVGLMCYSHTQGTCM